MRRLYDEAGRVLLAPSRHQPLCIWKSAGFVATIAASIAIFATLFDFRLSIVEEVPGLMGSICRSSATQ